MNTATIHARPAALSNPLAPSLAHGAARYLGQPVLLAGVGLAIAASIGGGAPLGLASVAILFAAVAYLFLMERAIPFRTDWNPTAREWRRDGIYFGINGLLSAGIGAGAGLLGIYLARGTTGLSLGAELPLGFLLYSLVGYWTHRLGHDVSALWQLHGVHHAPDKVNAWNNNVIHFLDLALQNGAALAALVLVGFSPETVFAITASSQAVGFVDHVNADFRLGWLNYVIGSAEQHRLHHSTELEEAGHYSILPLWDILFGTFTWRPHRVPAAVGIVDAERFPSPDSIAGNAVHPLRAWFRRGH